MKRVLLVMGLAAIAVGFFQIAGQRGVVPQAAAQGRPDVEAQHRRLLPLFELAGVVFTDADESTGRRAAHSAGRASPCRSSRLRCAVP